MSVTYEQKAVSGLEHLSLTVARDQLDAAGQRAAAEQWSYSHLLGYLLEAEIDARHQNTVRINLQFSKLPYIKRLAGFDFAAQPSIDRRIVDELATGRFLSDGRNLVLLGPPGVGKTHLAIALGVLVAEMGHRIYFTTAIEMVRRLTKAMKENRLSREVKNLLRPKLLIIDEVGYLTLDRPQASLLFQIVAQRYEREQPLVLTSNKAFADWGEVFVPVIRSWPRRRSTGCSTAPPSSTSTVTVTRPVAQRGADDRQLVLGDGVCL